MKESPYSLHKSTSLKFLGGGEGRDCMLDVEGLIVSFFLPDDTLSCLLNLKFFHTFCNM